jgi:Fuc2NAc and GlcNAc transferase
VTLLSLICFKLIGVQIGAEVFYYVAGALLVAAAGLLDDVRHLSAGWRLLVHFTAAGLAVLGIHNLPIPFRAFAPGFMWWLIPFLATVFIVWMLNLYNFMDGIDGIAAIEAAIVSGAAAALLWHKNAGELALFSAVLSAVSCGFLIWNWAPAKIFMGDVGSGFIGFSFGWLVLSTYARSALPVWVWLILLGAFIVDATVTLVRRIIRGEVWYQAHRSHAYQYASRKIGSHQTVAVAVGIINVAWLIPLAALVATGRLAGLTALVIAYAPLLGLTSHFRAGARELQDV